MPRLAQIEIDKVKEANDIVDVISEYVNLDKSSGSNLFGLCPFHGEKTASFSVSKSKQIYYCFGCHNGGDVIKFIMEVEKLSYIEAIQFLAKRVGITLKYDEEYIDPKKKDKEVLKKILKESAKHFLLNLSKSSGKPAAIYLNERKIDVDTAYKFGLGYANNEIIKKLKGSGFSDKLIEQCGLFKRGKKGLFCLFNNRLTFPIFDSFGNVIAMGGRKLNDDDFGPKYLNSPDTLLYDKSRELYALNIAKKSNMDYFIIVEGYMDTISLHQAGVDNAIAVLGTALTYSQAKLIRKYKQKVILCFDNDMAGHKATIRSLEILKSNGIEVSILLIPNAKDPDQFIKEFGKERFYALIDNSLNEVEYKLYIAKKNSKKDKRPNLFFANEATRILAEIEDSITLAYYVRKISEELLISPNILEEEVNKVKNKSVKSSTTKKNVEHKVLRQEDKVKETESANLLLEKNSDVFSLYVAILRNNNYINNDAVMPLVNDYIHDAWKLLFSRTINDIRERGYGTYYLPAYLREYNYAGINLQSLISKIFMEGNNDKLEDGLQSITVLCKNIKLSSLTKKRDKLANMIQMGYKVNDMDKVNVLREQYNRLSKEIVELRLNN